MDASAGGDPDLTFLTGGGEAARLIAGFDWAAGPLGRIGAWPPGRRGVLSMMLRAHVPMVTLWGEEGVMIYNDAYSAFAGNRHPGLFGSRVREGWPEVAAFNDNVMRTCLTGRTLSYRDEELTLVRNGVAEPVWLNLDYSPILDEAGAPVAVLAIVVDTTAKVRAERRLEGERERLRQMFEQAPGAAAVVEGPDHVFTLANAAYTALVGGRAVIGRRLRDALPEAEAQGFGRLLDTVRRTGEPYVGRGVRLMLDAGGDPSEHYLDFIYQPITGETGEVTGIFVQTNDVTELKRAELAVRESEARFRLVAENAPVMLWMGDVTGKCVYLNPPQRAFWGVAEEDVAAFDWAGTIHPDDGEAIGAPYAAAMREHKGFAVESRFRRADGAYRLIQSIAQPRFGPDGAFLGMIGVNVDVTEQRRTEAAIREESQRLAVLNRTGAALAAELDLERIVQVVVDACVALIGAKFGAFFYNVADADGERYTLYALAGAPRSAFAGVPMPRATAVFQPTFRGEAIVRSDDILADPRYGRSEPYRGMPKGHLPVRSYLAVPVLSRSGEVVGGLFFGHADTGRFTAVHEEIVAGIAGQAATAMDSSRLFAALERELAERRRAEEALQMLNETLEQRVADAIAERMEAEEALRQAQKTEALGQLTGGVAHDFNNLLQVISGNLQLLARDVAGNAQAEGRIADALAGVGQGAKLASQLLAFGRRQPLEPRVVNLGRLVTSMGELLCRTIGEGIEVETQVADGLWNTLVDPVRLETAVLNLALNGRDAMDGVGTLAIEVGNAAVDHPGSGVERGEYVRLAVRDTGTGIPPELIDRVFDPFFTTKPFGKGTGLGLSMVFGFVKQSGGHVEIESGPGRGTTVRIYLPRIDRSEDLPAEAAPEAVAGGSETILVAEDDDRVRATVVGLLSDLGYRVLTARDAAGALNVIESGERVDLLFTDVVMPGRLRSPELARLARERLPGLAVLFTSGYAEDAIVHDGRLDADVELLSKPYTREDLARKVRQVLGRAQPAEMSTTLLAGLTVLLCEDDALIRINAADLLHDLGAEVVEAGSGGRALALLAERAVDVAIIDVGLPDMSGIEVARRLREGGADLPILFATGHAGLPEAAAIAGSATLHKPYGELELGQAVARLAARGTT